LKYKKLGKSGIKVSEIGFGAWTIALNWWGKEIEEDEAKRMLKKAYDVGINFFETADMYGKGKSEKLIGEVFSGMAMKLSFQQNTVMILKTLIRLATKSCHKGLIRNSQTVR